MSEDSQFSRLLEVVLPRGGYVMALWEAYFDESGNDDMSTVFCLGGYVMRSEAARGLQVEWRKALKKAGVSYFHMVDVASGNEEFRWVPISARIGLQTKCIELIKKYAMLASVSFSTHNATDYPKSGATPNQNALRKAIATFTASNRTSPR